MGEIINTLKGTPIPTVLVWAGLFFLVLSFVNKLGAVIEPKPNQQMWTIPLGLFLLTLGLVLNSIPNQSTPVLTSVVPTIQSSISTPLSSLSPTPTPIVSSPSLTPTPNPSPISTASTSKDPYIGPTIQKAVDGNVTWELKSCLRELSNVHCVFSINTSKEGSYGIRVGSTKIQVSGGDEYPASLVQSGNRQSSAGGNDGIHIDMAHNEPYKVIIDFSRVPVSASRIIFLDICVNDCLGHVKMSDISIS